MRQAPDPAIGNSINFAPPTRACPRHMTSPRSPSPLFYPRLAHHTRRPRIHLTNTDPPSHSPHFQSAHTSISPPSFSHAPPLHAHLALAAPTRRCHRLSHTTSHAIPPLTTPSTLSSQCSHTPTTPLALSPLHAPHTAITSPLHSPPHAPFTPPNTLTSTLSPTPHTAHPPHTHTLSPRSLLALIHAPPPRLSLSPHTSALTPALPTPSLYHSAPPLHSPSPLTPCSTRSCNRSRSRFALLSANFAQWQPLSSPPSRASPMRLHSTTYTPLYLTSNEQTPPLLAHTLAPTTPTTSLPLLL